MNRESCSHKHLPISYFKANKLKFVKSYAFCFAFLFISFNLDITFCFLMHAFISFQIPVLLRATVLPSPLKIHLKLRTRLNL